MLRTFDKSISFTCSKSNPLIGSNAASININNYFFFRICLTTKRKVFVLLSNCFCVTQTKFWRLCNKEVWWLCVWQNWVKNMCHMVAQHFRHIFIENYLFDCVKFIQYEFLTVMWHFLNSKFYVTWFRNKDDTKFLVWHEILIYCCATLIFGS